MRFPNSMGTRREFLAKVGGPAVAAASTRPAQSSKPPSRQRPGTVQTVQGRISASKLGFTLPHEHICASSAGFWQAWPEFFGGGANFISKVVQKLKVAKDEGV